MQITRLGTHIKVRDFEASKAFYLGLGFVPVFAYGPEEEVKEVYRGMVFEHGGGKLEIADGHRAVKGKVFERRMADSKVSLMINVESLVPLMARLRKQGIEPAVGPRHYYWGTLEVVVKDPDGVVLVFIASYSAAEARELQADERFGRVD